MEFILKLVCFILLLSGAMGQSEPDTEENSRRFHIDQHKDTRETVKTDMDGFFSKLWDMMVKLNASLLKLERSHETLAANLSRELDEKMGNLYRNLSEAFNEKLLRIESKMGEEHGSLNETLGANPEQLWSSLTNSTASLNPNPMRNGETNLSTVGRETEIIPTSQPPVLTEVEEVSLESGTIEFTGGANSPLRRKLWVFRSKSRNSYLEVKFVMEQNKLGDDARLSIWGSDYGEGGQRVWNGSQSNWADEQETEGHLVLLTLSISPSAALKPSFKLKFTTTTKSDSLIRTSEVVLGEGTQVVSFPPNNTNNFPPRSYFVALIAPPHGRPVQLTLRYFDLPGNPTSYCHYDFYVYLLDESSTGVPYKRLPPSVVRRCGSVGAISEPIGNSTVAILWFYGTSENVGKGFRVEVKPN